MYHSQFQATSGNPKTWIELKLTLTSKSIMKLAPSLTNKDLNNHKLNEKWEVANESSIICGKYHITNDDCAQLWETK